MNRVVKSGLYLGLIIAAVIFFGRFRSAYSKVEVLGPAELRGDATATNALPASAAAAAEAIGTNVVATTPSTPPASLETNSTAVAAESVAKPVAKDGSKTPGTPPAGAPKRDPSKPFFFLGLFVATLAGFGALAAWDVSHYFGSRTERELTAEDFALPSDPAYEAAEDEWTKGNHLDAINLMREYLKRNPSEQHVAIRIAEIYEKDLNNYLAAVLELEEVLKQKLPREKWGWTAIHLANLYSGKLNQTSKALGVLNRIVQHYPDTAAARKARQRLGLPEPEEVAAGADADASEPESSAESASTPEPPAPSNLPKGFRTKK